MSQAHRSKRAVVVGGSMAGLLAARVLSDHFDEVVILERDELPSDAAMRAGVPQGRHAHLLLERGRRIIERLLPGIQAEMLAAGARLLDLARDVSWLSWWGELVRYECGVPSLACSRPFLEHHVRRRVLGLSNVRVRAGAMVASLEGTAIRVSGVRLQDGEVVTADLVIDAGGRDSATPRWLEALGIAPPAESLVKPFLGYASRRYEPPLTKVWDRDLVIVSARSPQFTRGIAMFPVENGGYIVSLMGVNGDHPPTSEPEFLDWARSLGEPAIMEWLAAARPLGPIYGFRFEQNRLRHFERCALPAGLLAVGDAVVSFNPVYGQGMTTAAMATELLESVLAESRGVSDDLPRRYHRRLAKLIAPAWTLTTTEDLRFPGTVGKRSLGQRIARAYVDRVFLLAVTRPEIRTAIIEVLGMTRPPTHLFKIGVLSRVLFTTIPSHKVRAQHGLAATGAAPRLPAKIEVIK